MEALYGITGLSTDPLLTGGLVATTLSGFNQLGRQATNPQFQNPLSFDPKLNFTKNLKRHIVKIGYEFVVIRTQVLDVNPLYGRDSYAGAFTRPTATSPADASSYSIADFLFGLRSQYALANTVIGNYRQHEHFFYVQDDYRVNNKLTQPIAISSKCMQLTMAPLPGTWCIFSATNAVVANWMPTTVNGFPASFCLRNTPNTAP